MVNISCFSSKLVLREIQWLLHFQLIPRVKEDIYTERGLIRELAELEKVITQQKDHLLGRLCKPLLQYDRETEQVKMGMVKWILNFEEEFSFQQ